MFKKLSLFLLTIFIASLFSTTVSYASANLVADCPAYGVCALANDPPGGTIDPLFVEANWVPGSSVVRYIRITNSSAQNGFAALEVINYGQTPGRPVPTNFDMGNAIDIYIYRDFPFDINNLVYGGVTLSQFRDDGYFTVDSLNAGQSHEYHFVAMMQTSAGNDYQGGRVEFDLNVGLEVEPLPPESGGGDGTGNPGGFSAPGPASPPVCHDPKPSSAPANFRIVSSATNTITLAWNPVSPATHYALVFTRDSDGAAYGASNIGNTTQYTITNLSGGDSYSFEVFAVNGCMPGDRAGLPSPVIAGPFIEGRPLGPGGQVLGVTEEEASKEADLTAESASVQDQGLVAGATETCTTWKLYIPWVLLIAQTILIFVIDYYFKKKRTLTKHYLALGVTLASIGIFYLVRECQCYNNVNFLTWLCKWYFIVSLAITLLLKVFSYAFIEEVED